MPAPVSDKYRNWELTSPLLPSPEKAINEKRKEIELLITGYNLGIDYIKMHPQKNGKQVLIEIGVPENLTGLIALPVYRKKRERASADDLDKSSILAESKQIGYSDIFRPSSSDRYNFYKNKLNLLINNNNKSHAKTFYNLNDGVHSVRYTEYASQHRRENTIEPSCQYAERTGSVSGRG